MRDTTPVVKLLLNARDAAAALSISERHLWSLTQDGVIPAVRLGRSIRYCPRTIAAWIEQRQAAALSSEAPSSTA